MENKIDPKNQDKTNNMVITFANLISMARAISAIPIIYTLQYPQYHWITAIIILIAVLSDALDGYFARQAGQISYLGKWLDPIADFIVMEESGVARHQNQEDYGTNERQRGLDRIQ